MNCFKLVKDALDSMGERLEGGVKNNREVLMSTMETMVGNYYKTDTIEIDYSDPISQFAYVFVFSAAHGIYLKEVMNKSSELCRYIEEKDAISISSLGGGPGSDMLGCLKFISCVSSEEQPKKVFYESFDKHAFWSFCWSHISGCISSNRDDGIIELYSTFHQLDVTTGESLVNYKSVKAADINIMSYFLSEVHMQQQIRESMPFLKMFIDKMKSGAFLIFIDITAKNIPELFDKIFMRSSFDVVKNDVILEGRLPFDEQKDVLGEYLGLFGKWQPALNANLAYRILKKK